MPKQKHDDVNKLLTNMKGSAAAAKGPQKTKQDLNQRDTKDTEVKVDALHRHIDLAPYKEHQGWPGRGYLLVGNSFNMERKVGKDNAKGTKRTASIALLLEHGKGNRHCVTVEEALCHAGFVEALSRFEFDWLRREPQTSLIGPAYDHQGKLVTNSFAVWRVDYVQTPARQSKQLVGAK